jgi:hypothetical protein
MDYQRKKENIMKDEKTDLLETFRKLDPVNQADVLAHIHVAYATQESTKKYLLDRLLGRPEYANRDPVPMGEVVHG